MVDFIESSTVHMKPRGIEENTFAFPEIGRSGMCNELFPWARAEIFGLTHGLSILAPSWTRFRIGPYLRREPDKRRYGSMFRSVHHIHGFKRFRILSWCRKLSENGDLSQLHAKGWPMVVAFAGMEGGFTPLLQWSEFLRERLWEMTRPELRPSLVGEKPYVAMHIRRGDITRAGFTPEELLEVKQYTPLSWFIAIGRAIRARSEFDSWPIRIFTDGSEDEIQDLLTLPGIELPVRGSPIGDLWGIAQSRLLLASGYSTFSMWGSFLGRMPTIYAPGKMQPLQFGDGSSIELELDEQASLPDDLLAQVLS